MIETLEKMTEQAREISRLINTFNEVDSPLSDDGQVGVNVIRDASERILMLMEEYLLEVQKEDMNEQRLEAGLVFDVRNPVNMILTASDYLLEIYPERQDANLTEQQKELIETIQDIAAQMSEYLSSVRDKLYGNWRANQDNPA